MLKSPLYDKLKFVAQMLLPVLGTLYFVLTRIWDLPSAAIIVGIIVTIDAILGIFLHISTGKYKENMDDVKHGRIQGGVIRITDVGDKKIFSLELEGDPVIFEDNKEVVFKVHLSAAEIE